MAGKELQPKEKREVEARGEMTQARPVFLPAVDIIERDEALELLADMPGVKNDGVHIHLEDNQLTIRGVLKATESKGTPLYTEYRVGDYYRTFTLSDIIDQDKIEASMKDGVLKVVLPKAEAAKPRRITVTAA